jgi:hypothetical protein
LCLLEEEEEEEEEGRGLEEAGEEEEGQGLEEATGVTPCGGGTSCVSLLSKLTSSAAVLELDRLFLGCSTTTMPCSTDDVGRLKSILKEL